MAIVSNPPRPWILGLAVAMVALVAVPFGLAIGALVPRELEATLILIGVVGIQLSSNASDALSTSLTTCALMWVRSSNVRSRSILPISLRRLVCASCTSAKT